MPPRGNDPAASLAEPDEGKARAVAGTARLSWPVAAGLILGLSLLAWLVVTIIVRLLFG